MTKEYLRVFVCMFLALIYFIGSRTAKDKTWSNVWTIFTINQFVQLVYWIYKLEV